MLNDRLLFIVLVPSSIQSRLSHINHGVRSRRQYNLFQSNSFPRQSHIKFLHLSTLTCIDTIEPSNHRSLFYLNSSNSFCSYRKYCPSTCSCCSSPTILKINCDCQMFCPIECSCKHSYDLTNNYVNCSKRQLNKIPFRIPHATTHLFLNNNQIKSIDNNLTHLTNLKYLSLANNDLQYLSDNEFSTTNKIEHLDLSSNRIQDIQPKTFANLISLRKLYLHNNLWIPKFYDDKGEFQSSIRLRYLTYGKGLSCSKSSTVSFIERPLTTEDCCNYSTSESCQMPIENTPYNNSTEQNVDLKKLSQFFLVEIHQKSILMIFVLLLFIVICIITLCLYRKKRLLLLKQKYLSSNDIKKDINHNNKKGKRKLNQNSCSINLYFFRFKFPSCI